MSALASTADGSNDALRAHGIIPQKPEEPEEPDVILPSSTDLLHALASTATADQLGLLANEANDSDDERMFETYRRQRIAEMGVERKKARFGSLEPLARDEFVREVTEGSKLSYDANGDAVQPEVKAKKAGYDDEDDDEDEEEEGKSRGLKGTGVVVFLYKDSCVTCVITDRDSCFPAACRCASTCGRCCKNSRLCIPLPSF